MIAELDYFCGGKVFKKLDKDRNLDNFQIFEVCKISDEQKLKILKVYNDELISAGVFYSFRRYNFNECKKYIDFSPQKIRLFIANIGQFVVNFTAFKNKPKNGCYNCVKLTFETLNHCKANHFKRSTNPYELLIESYHNSKK